MLILVKLNEFEIKRELELNWYILLLRDERLIRAYIFFTHFGPVSSKHLRLSFFN